MEVGRLYKWTNFEFALSDEQSNQHCDVSLSLQQQGHTQQPHPLTQQPQQYQRQQQQQQQVPQYQPVGQAYTGGQSAGAPLPSPSRVDGKKHGQPAFSYLGGMGGGQVQEGEGHVIRVGGLRGRMVPYLLSTLLNKSLCNEIVSLSLWA